MTYQRTAFNKLGEILHQGFVVLEDEEYIDALAYWHIEIRFGSSAHKLIDAWNRQPFSKISNIGWKYQLISI